MKKTKKNAKQEQPKSEQLNKKENSEKDKVLDSLIGTIGEVEEALEGDVSNVELQTEESALFSPEKPLLKKRKTFFAVGIFIFIMAVVGVISSVRFCTAFVSDIANQTALKNEFAVFLYPVVITDTPAFASVDEAPDSIVINTSLWKILLSGDTAKYSPSNGMLTVPEIDVESAAASIFGAGLTIEHQNTGVGENVFYYDETTKTYSVPESPRFSSYSPRVSEITSVGELYTVTVEYMPPTAFSVDGINYETAPDKTMIYTVSRTATKMTIQSVAYGVMTI